MIASRLPRPLMAGMMAQQMTISPGPPQTRGGGRNCLVPLVGILFCVLERNSRLPVALAGVCGYCRQGFLCGGLEVTMVKRLLFALIVLLTAISTGAAQQLPDLNYKPPLPAPPMDPEKAPGRD